MVKKIKFLSFFVMLFTALTINAQVTTSAISGSVVDEKGEAMIGASVMAKHTPSGTTYGAATNLDGRFNIQGMRTGGPYTVTVDYVGYKTVVYEGIYLQLGNATDFDVKLEVAAESLGEVVVIGTGRAAQAGASANFSLSKIQGTPTVDRDIYDVVKNMPMVNANKAGGLSFAGSNNRFNSFQIDGAAQNDVFGLTSSGTNGGQSSAQPISLEAIQELQVVISPFDVRQSGFTGGGINAITKQGTNDFKASVYTYYNNEKFYGRMHPSEDKPYYDPLTKQYTHTIGGNIAGAIVKDKLFFFVNVENKKQSYPASYWPGYTDKYLSAAQAQQILDHYNVLTGNKYADSYSRRDVKSKDFDILARVDWNIDEKNKLAVRYQHKSAYDDKYSPSATTYYFNNSSYRMNNSTNSFVAELNSRINNEWSNELRASYVRVRDHRDVAYQGPTVYLQRVHPEDPQFANTNLTINLGTEYSSGINFLDQDIILVEDNVTYYTGRHAWTFGTHNEIFKITNGFFQYANGEWVYQGLDNFLNDNPSSFYFKCADPTVTNGNMSYSPTMKMGQFGAYAQDKFDVNRNLQLTYGVRLDIPVFFSQPTTNVAFNKYSHQKGWGVRVGETPSAKLMVSPRFGFRWFTDAEHKSLIRGGVGLFTGRVPFVWMSNAFTNNGIEQIGTTINTTSDIPSMSSSKQELVDAMVNGTASRPDIVTVSKDYRFPQVFRANLAWDYTLPYDIKMTLEGLYSKTLNNMYFENLALTQAGSVYAVPGVEASAAPFYSVDNTYYTVINTKNTNKGYTYQLALQLQKSFDFGLDLNASYTFGHSKSITDGTSSVAYSCWKYNYAVDTNNPKLSYSTFDIPNRVVVAANYTTPKYANNFLQSTIGLVYTGNNGMRYSLTMYESADFNGDGYKGNSLLFIPTQEQLAKMNFSKEEDKAKFEEFIQGDKYAKNHRGQFAERNSNQGKWENRVDLHFAETFFYLKNRGSKIELTLDILNFANMLCDKWGASYGSTYNLSKLAVSKVEKTGEGIYSPVYSYNDANIEKSNIYSRWHMQIGLKVTF